MLHSVIDDIVAVLEHRKRYAALKRLLNYHASKHRLVSKQAYTTIPTIVPSCIFYLQGRFAAAATRSPQSIL